MEAQPSPWRAEGEAGAAESMGAGLAPGPPEPPGATHFTRRNYALMGVEGGLFIGGMAFIGVDSVLPPMVQALGAPDWVVAFMPTLMMLGFMAPALFTAHFVERLVRVKPFLLATGVFQRLPFFISGLALLFLSASWPGATWAVVALAPFASGVAGGLAVTAWLELMSKVVAPGRQASCHALRSLIGAAIGWSAGFAVARILAAHPGPTGYAILQFCTFGCLAGSLVVFALISEPPDWKRSSGPGRSLWENLGSMPALLKASRAFRSLALFRACAASVFIVVPFLSIEALRVLEADQAFLGKLVQAQTVGMVVGNVVAGIVGDRFGGPANMALSSAAFLLVSWWGATATTAWGWMAVFFMLGVGQTTNVVGFLTTQVQLFAAERRPTYLALTSAVTFVAMLSASGLSIVLRQVSGGIELAAWVAATLCAGSFLFLSGLRRDD